MAEQYFWSPNKVSSMTFAQIYWLSKKSVSVAVPAGGSVADAVRLAKQMRG